MKPPLPEYNNPPLVEVVLGVQFEKLDTLRTAHLGFVWQAFRDRFPKTEEQPPLEPVFEHFGLKSTGRAAARLELFSAPPVPRLWFLDESGAELVQVQQDRFIRNWRKRGETDVYPRYPRLRDSFRQDFELFCRLVEDQQWGRVEANQCEVTYVNLISAGEGWQRHGELERIITLFRASEGDLGLPEEASVNVKYALKDEGRPYLRLHVAAHPVVRAADGRPALRLTLTSRGRPEGGGIDAVLSFLDHGREAVVRSFTAITTPEMHQIWERKV